jgi:hypothetical protein
MTAQDFTLTLFTLCNAVRIFGYVPQILRSLRDTSGAASTSVMTWIVFFAGNASATAYAAINVHDWLMATIFGVNAICCAAITLLTLWQRQLFSKRRIVRSGKIAGQSPHLANVARVNRRVDSADGICSECAAEFGVGAPRIRLEGPEPAHLST